MGRVDIPANHRAAARNVDLATALRDARETIIAHYFGLLYDPRTRPSVIRRQVREIDDVLGDPPTDFDALAQDTRRL